MGKNKNIKGPPADNNSAKIPRSFDPDNLSTYKVTKLPRGIPDEAYSGPYTNYFDQELGVLEQDGHLGGEKKA